jgi:hypothetical protein
LGTIPGGRRMMQTACTIAISPKCEEHEQQFFYFCKSREILCDFMNPSDPIDETSCIYQERGKHPIHGTTLCSCKDAKRKALDDAREFINREQFPEGDER